MEFGEVQLKMWVNWMLLGTVGKIPHGRYEHVEI